MSGKRKHDDHFINRMFSALFPAFDFRPRGPGATYVIVYREVKETSGQRLDMPESLSGSRRSSSLPQLPLTGSTNCSMDELLQLIRQLYINTEHRSELHSAEFLSW